MHTINCSGSSYMYRCFHFLTTRLDPPFHSRQKQSSPMMKMGRMLHIGARLKNTRSPGIYCCRGCNVDLEGSSLYISFGCYEVLLEVCFKWKFYFLYFIFAEYVDAWCENVATLRMNFSRISKFSHIYEANHTFYHYRSMLNDIVYYLKFSNHT